MANDAPTKFVDTPGVLATAGAFRALGSWAGRTTADNQRYNYEKIVGPSGKAGDSRQVYSHAHAAQSATCGIIRPRDLVNEVYVSATYGAMLNALLTTEGWTELDRQRTFTVGNTSITTEVLVSGTPAYTAGAAVRFRVKYCLANDSASCGATVHYLEETAAISGSATWHTIKGQLDGAGTTVSSLTLDGPTGPTTPSNTQAHIEMILEAHAATGFYSLATYAWRSWAGSL